MTPDRFVADNTAIARAPLVPELRLYLADEATPLWHATAALLDDAGAEPPFWAFAWPGGQAVARHVLDHPEAVAGRHVLDVAAGGGIAAIAAARAGAAQVTVNDVDPFAAAAAAMNARLNHVAIEIVSGDLTTRPPDGRWDVILAGDVFYDRAMAAAIGPWLATAAREGTEVLVGDPGRAYLPAAGLVRVAVFEVPTSRELEAGDSMETTVWAIEG